MYKKVFVLCSILFFSLGVSFSAMAGKVPAPEKGGEGFKAVTLAEAKALVEDKETVVVACHSHTTDFMKGHPEGTIHITCMVPKDHKRTDLALDQIDFDIAQLPTDKSTPIMLYCASGT